MRRYARRGGLREHTAHRRGNGNGPRTGAGAERSKEALA